MKQNSVSSEIKRLTIDKDGESDKDESEFVSPEVEYLEKFSKYLDFKRNDIIRLSKRKHALSPGVTMNIEADISSNDLSREELV